nr:putative bifunctional riboflavin kinase/FMN adenylyltransferase [uncultured bacterium]
MQFIRGIENLSSAHRPTVVSIGNYDGVHLGHQHVIKTLLDHSRQLHAPSTVITFDPLAKEFFAPDSAVRLTSVEQRAQQLFALGVDRVLCIEFNTEFAANSPLEFVEEILVNLLGVRYLCVGDDFRFGKDREGDFEFLKVCGARHGFVVEAHDTFMLGGERVSSGRVRQALQAGDFGLAEQLLGRPYSLSGMVSCGQQLGRTLNYPTANIVLDAERFAVSGVYAVRVSGAREKIAEGVANVGTRPTVDGNENRLEVHLFDFDADIYGTELEVQFCRKIRDEHKFGSIESLKQQIIADADAARAYFLEQRA